MPPDTAHSARVASPAVQAPPTIGDLLTSVADADHAAFTALHDVLAPRVFGLCRRLIRDTAEAEDVTQEVFLEVWTKAGRYDPARGSAIGWIYRIAHHRAVDRIRTTEATRRRDTAHATPTQHHHDDAIQHLLDAADRLSLHAALDKLSQRRHEALIYAFYTEHNYQQASDLLGIPLPTFKSRVRDALIALRPLLQDRP